eukprot:gb/GEZN01009841.1/.p1 GENE.gb/GEZN01009841.1/~~gb/GEZN01009841.1/.p1  ORF type:complete len:333 (-),score=42.42 gb/GEZN01009841.1/:191-1189(-)
MFAMAPIEKASFAGALLPTANVVAFLVTIVMNAISSVGALSPYGVGEVSGWYETMITPASYAFSIWSLIYFSVAVFAIWQCFPSLRDDDLVFNRIGYWFVLSCCCNSLWIAIFVQGEPVAVIWISSVLLFSLFGCLMVILLRTEAWMRAFSLTQSQVTVSDFAASEEDTPLSPRQSEGSMWKLALSYYAVDFTFSIYCAWCTVASILNVALSLIGSGVYENQVEWAITILVVAAVIFLAMVRRKWNWAYGFVFTWAAIAIRNADQCGGMIKTTDGTFDDTAGCDRVQLTAYVLAIIVGVVSGFTLIQYSLRVLIASEQASKGVAGHQHQEME